MWLQLLTLLLAVFGTARAGPVAISSQQRIDGHWGYKNYAPVRWIPKWREDTIIDINRRHNDHSLWGNPWKYAQYSGYHGSNNLWGKYIRGYNTKWDNYDSRKNNYADYWNKKGNFGMKYGDWSDGWGHIINHDYNPWGPYGMSYGNKYDMHHGYGWGGPNQYRTRGMTNKRDNDRRKDKDDDDDDDEKKMREERDESDEKKDDMDDDKKSDGKKVDDMKDDKKSDGKKDDDKKDDKKMDDDKKRN